MGEQGHAAAGGVKDEFLEQHLWPPFTQMQGLAPIVMERADGALVWDSDGNEYIDAFASLWTVNVGHGRKAVSYTHLRAHETVLDLVCRLLLEKKTHKTREVQQQLTM